MGNLGDRFMAAFNEIEHSLRRALNAEEHVEFGSLARQFADRKRLPRAHRDSLSAFASLRNAISHSRYRGGIPIAEPVVEVVEDIERLRDLILTPPLAVSAITRQTVRTVKPDDPLTAALEWVRQYDFSQLPVYDDDRYSALLTTNAVARWLAAQLGDVGLVEEVPVADVLGFREPQDEARLVPRTITAAEATYALERGGDRGQPLALVVTQSGRAHEQPLAILVKDDLPSLADALLIR